MISRSSPRKTCPSEHLWDIMTRDKVLRHATQIVSLKPWLIGTSKVPSNDPSNDLNNSFTHKIHSTFSFTVCMNVVQSSRKDRPLQVLIPDSVFADQIMIMWLHMSWLFLIASAFWFSDFWLQVLFGNASTTFLSFWWILHIDILSCNQIRASERSFLVPTAPLVLVPSPLLSVFCYQNMTLGNIT